MAAIGETFPASVRNVLVRVRRLSFGERRGNERTEEEESRKGRERERERVRGVGREELLGVSLSRRED